MGLVRLVHLRLRIKPMTFFTDSGIVCHIFHRTAVHCLYFYLIFTSLGLFYLALHMTIDQSMEAKDNTLLCQI